MTQTTKEAYDDLVDAAESINRALHTSGTVTYGSLSGIKHDLEVALARVEAIQKNMVDAHNRNKNGA